MSTVNIPSKHTKTFFRIIKRLGLETRIIGQMGEGRHSKNIFRVYGTRTTSIKSLQKHITNPSKYGYTNSDDRYCQYMVANAFYSLWTTSTIRVNEFEYPTKEDWDLRHPKSSVDHDLPKSIYPLKTFDASNWVPSSYSDNKAKGNDVGEVLARKLKEVKTKSDYYAAFLGE